ncbi:Ankyrin repeat protein [Aspergillus sp. HF37]|nr:Ankyrin repeat protein [Aspergillus sp. HF37]
MPRPQLPTELIIQVAEHLDDERTINAMARSNRCLHYFLSPVLYRHNAQYSRSSALRWAVTHCAETTVRKCFDNGAVIDPVSDSDIESDSEPESVSIIGGCYFGSFIKPRPFPLITLATESGHEAIVQLLLDHGADPNTPNQRNQSPLLLAVLREHIPVLRLLLAQENIDLSPAVDDDGRKPFAEAVDKERLDIIELLLQSSASFSTYRCGGPSPLGGVKTDNDDLRDIILRIDPVYCINQTPLVTAARYRHAQLVRFFLDRGADPHAEDSNGNTALSLWAEAGCVEPLQALLAAGARADAQNNDGRTPLSLAAGRGCLEAVKTLVAFGAEVDLPDQAGRTPLSWAAICGPLCAVRVLDTCSDKRERVGTIETLLDGGADIRRRDNEDHTPLSRALEARTDYAIELLLRRGADPDFAATHGSETLLHAARSGLPRLVVYLIENGVHPDPTDDLGLTPLLLVAASGCTIPEALLRAPAVNVHVQDHIGGTPLSIVAANNSDPKAAEILLERGAEVDTRNNTGQTPLSFAAAPHRHGNTAIMNMLLRAGADVNAEDSLKRTPLWYAAAANVINRVNYQFLVDNGADPFLQDNFGVTPHSRSLQFARYSLAGSDAN